MTTTAELERFIVALYEDLADRAAFDARLADDVTVWETPWPTLMHGIAELDELRGPAADPEERRRTLPSVVPTGIVTNDFGDTGVIRYVLEVRPAAGGPLVEVVRVTDVVRRDADGWRIVHHHAQDMPVE
ncbi:nuclear transport factor 2 family protein [Microbacterium sp. NPDC055988]|uniref:nuclear transport factor 2 family protein n=1 Tax=Microbacterium sp. NPDC055988 TaxID=3345671 RepID=UPI0035D96FB5